ncbi:phosphatase PAP2 family protein [Mucilaginibacter daejeonensis]|uniref:phosphatase PAP2 family protein n=1 Tax=Mucilaginibacter daejeonensis TaxID=398049 RepID=UPI001D17C9D1|nr:phosphatase PAP2 family protein [Mucilaginibacter daejeonensis]UEG55238.1 phosphatase PAP2 family protein [Mucilaginibacter daejeonensis]
MNTRITDVLHHIRFFLLPYLIILITCIIIKITHSREAIYFAVNARHSDLGDLIFPYVTDLGEGFMVVSVTLIMLLFSYRKTILIITSFAFSGIMVQIFKHLFRAPRPIVYFEKQLDHIHFVKGVAMMHTNSFPSGHTVTAFSAAVVLSYLAVNKRWGFIYLLVAISVAYSRMYLSQHFFEDVTAGSIVGSMSTLMWVTWMDNRPFMHAQRVSKGLLRR